jgi:hypothetical protein
MIRTIILLVLLLCAVPAPSDAGWTLKPFAGITFASSHGFVDLDNAAGTVKPMVGGAVGWDWPNRFGVELELATAPSFLKGASGLVETGRLDTLFVNGNWRLRPAGSRFQPYFAIGAGAARVALDDVLGAFTSTTTLAAGNIGGGMIAATSARLRLIGDVRYVRSQFRDGGPAAVNERHVAYWRATGGVVFRF